MGANPLRIRSDKVDGFVKMYDETRYLVLIGSERHDAIYNRIRNLISKKSVLQILLIVILQESELIHIILYL